MRTLPICFLAPAAVVLAQDNPFSAFNKLAYGQLKVWGLGSAEKMPRGELQF